MPKLTTRQALFVTEYLKDLNATQAAIRAGYSENHHRVLDSPEVQEAIAAAHAERNARVLMDADEVLREIAAVATADANELIEYRRECCRFCHGTGHRYQRTAHERERDFNAFKIIGLDLIEVFDEQGGIGFDPRKDPHADCPECHGEGVGSVFVKDTRRLSPLARKLYAGAKVTKDGIEIKTHSRDKNIELLARHLGLLNDKLELKGKLSLTVATGVPGIADDLV